MERIELLVVDDHAIVREGICALLETSPETVVLGEAANGYEALEMLTKLQPDVVLMDIVMPIMDGFEATRRICKDYPSVKVLILTQYDDREHVFEIIEAGAAGFINKSVVSTELVNGIRAVYHGNSFLSPQVAKYLVNDLQTDNSVKKNRDPFSTLTGREREIFKLLAEGYTTREISEYLVLSPKTVEGHKTRLMSKLDLHNRVDLVKYAMRKGIIVF